MVGVDRLANLLSSQGFDLAGEIILNPAVAGGVFIPLKIERDLNGIQKPSHRDLANVKNLLAAFGFEAEFLLVDRRSKSTEESLRASLISSFPNIVRNVFVTVSEGVANIWIDGKRSPTSEDSARIDVHLKQQRSNLSVKSTRLYFISEENIATNTEILNVIRKFSPIDCGGLEKRLAKRGFAVPSPDWINRKFDALRKAGLLVRFSDRSYVLTAEALHNLGTRKDRHSPDVARLLALARGGD